MDPWSDVDDYLLIDHEVVKVSSKDWAIGEMTVIRAQAGTLAATHIAGTAFQRVTHLRWMVWGIQIDVGKAQIRIKAKEMPVKDALLSGRIWGVGMTEFDASTTEEQLQGGWITPLNGLIYDQDHWS